ncbi:MAG: acetyl-CoA decarbonylase/synthase complex subunit alpha [Syntrophaceae bacterium PtaU1.Bin231]|jgi:heterodisulfide reductase subunit C|nr:MAG: acetyl-CoA decarbonylase/synthase complex subunit alpha [Syntrophaceae bacterium PtaU1.Bin231]HOG18600.1 4Fe-4S dicluster domain-containing protein [Syntrophales bacterium]HOI15448.1 4Fe-4S dicluster domain-containing protein [Geobacteraceae bacterium]
MSKKNLNMISIYVMGKRFSVPEDLTILKALEFSGFRITRGCGCRGGVCGACATVYRKQGDYRIYTSLACQTVIEPEMSLVQLPYISNNKPSYAVSEMDPESLDIVKTYPELLRCMGCNTCTKSCPVNLSVMNYISAAIRGDLERVVELSIECVMCGLCAARCPAELSPYNIALFIRRLYGAHMLKRSPQLEKRVKDIGQGVYSAEIAGLKKTDNKRLQEIFGEMQAKKGASV